MKVRCYRRSCNQHIVGISPLPLGGKGNAFTTLEARIPVIIAYLVTSVLRGCMELAFLSWHGNGTGHLTLFQRLSQREAVFFVFRKVSLCEGFRLKPARQ